MFSLNNERQLLTWFFLLKTGLSKPHCANGAEILARNNKDGSMNQFMAEIKPKT